MEKKIYQALSVLFFLAAAVTAIFTDWQAHWIFPVALFAISGLFLWSSISPKQVFLFLIFSLPFFFRYNNYKINLSFLSRPFNIPELSINVNAALYLFLIFVFLVFLLFRPKLFKKIPLSLILTATIAFFAATIFWSISPGDSLPKIIFYITPFFAYFLAFYLTEKKEDFSEIVLAIILSSFLPLLVGFSQLLTGDFFHEPDSSLGRLTGTFTQPNPFGLYLFLIIAITVTFIFSLKGEGKSRIKKFLSIYLVPLFIMLFLTYSRTSWIALLLFLVIFFSRQARYFWKFILLLVILFGIAFSLEAPRERLTGVFQRSLYDSVYARESIFKLGVGKFKEKPILGYGIGNFETVIQDAKESDEGSALAHNDLILFALEGGVLAAGFFILYSLGTLFYAGRYFLAARNKKTSLIVLDEELVLDMETFGRGALLIFISILVSGLAEAITTKTVMGIIFWIFLGTWFALAKKNDLPDR